MENMYLGINNHQKELLALADSEGKKISYGELCDIINRFPLEEDCSALVFILCDNCVDCVSGYLAMVSKRIPVLLLPNSIDQRLLHKFLEIYMPHYLWVPKNNAYLEYGSLMYESDTYYLVDTKDEGYKIHSDIAVLLTTSGTTGDIKLVKHGYNNLSRGAEKNREAMMFGPEDHTLIFLPLHHIYGLSVLNASLYAGTTVYLTKYTIVEKSFWDYLRECEITCFSGVPYHYEMIRKLKYINKEIKSLRLMNVGGGRLSADFLNELLEIGCNSLQKIRHLYGSTEGGIITCFKCNDKVEELSIGKPYGGSDIQLINSQGEVIHEPYVEGELVYKGADSSLGYVGNGEELSIGDSNLGVIYSGDLAKRDSDGYYYLVGRIKRIVKLYGERINLDQIEIVIWDAFSINCACVGTDDKITLYITEKDCIQDIRSYLINNLHLASNAFNVKSIDLLPRTRTGKIMYSEL